MSCSFTVRRATDRDADAILQCLAAAFAPYRESYTPAAFADTVLSKATIQRRRDSMDMFVACAPPTSADDGRLAAPNAGDKSDAGAEPDAGEEVVGTIGCALFGDGEGHLRGMAVRPEWQGSGVAAALLEAAESHLRASGCRRVTLDTTEPLQRAVRFYARHGYRATGTVAGFFGMRLFEYEKTL